MMKFTTEQRVSLMQLANLMRAARSDFSKGKDVFRWIWNEGEELLLDVMGDEELCNNLYYLVDDILTDLRQHALDWVVGEFDGRCFRDTKWDYNRIEMLAHDAVDQAMYNQLQFSNWSRQQWSEHALKALEEMVK
jgi:hypothetical protein